MASAAISSSQAEVGAAGEEFGGALRRGGEMEVIAGAKPRLVRVVVEVPHERGGV